jgi:hypothetical protein
VTSNRNLLRRRIWDVISTQTGTVAWSAVWEAIRPPSRNWGLLDGLALWRRVIHQISHQASEDHDEAKRD